MPDSNIGTVTNAPLIKAFSERYLDYAITTIVNRALPDARDGLKPVHRRIMYAMHQLKLSPTTPHKKSARVVGDVIGKYHPHGDASVYEAMVRMAQDFSVRYPLVDGQGNFGNIDGDAAAAMRYTESRLTRITDLMLKNLERGTVDFNPTYDDSEEEPKVLPSYFPNLLANGSSGIAVGMATNIPPHNIIELCDAACLLIDRPDATVADMMQFIKGPDFPTGCTIVEDHATILNAYETGRGSLRQRATWRKEDGRAGSWIIVVTEIPYQVQKSKLIEQVATLINERKLPLLADVRDESDEKIRIVFEPKSRTVDPDLLMESLYRTTPLESRFGINLNALDKNLKPGVMSIKEAMKIWIDHQHEILIRGSNFRLKEIERRVEILEGQIMVFLNLDRVIQIIRDSEDPKVDLVKEFKMTDLQVESVLNTRLRSLRRLDEMEIRAERDGLLEEKSKLNEMLATPALQWAEIRGQIIGLKEKFAKDPIAARLTNFSAAPAGFTPAAEAFVEKEPLTIIMSDMGWIRARIGHNVDDADLKFKDGDSLALTMKCQTTDRITLVCDNGRIYTLNASDLPRGRTDGVAVRVLFDSIGPDNKIIDMIIPDQTSKYLFTATTGKGFTFDGNSMTAEKKGGKVVMVVSGDERVLGCNRINPGMTHLLCRSTEGKMVIFPMEEVVEMGRGAGVTLQKIPSGETMIEARMIDPNKELQPPSDCPKGKPVTDLSTWMAHRATKGRYIPQTWLANQPKKRKSRN